MVRVGGWVMPSEDRKGVCVCEWGWGVGGLGTDCKSVILCTLGWLE